MSNQKRRIIITLAGVGITLVLVGLVPFMVAYAQEETPEATPVIPLEGTPQIVPGAAIYDPASAPTQATGNNSYCLVCHSQPWRAVTLANGRILNLFVDPTTIAASVHGTTSSIGPLGCVDCHGENSFPHSGPTPTDDRALTLASVSICTGCHQEQVEELLHGLHEQAIIAGNTSAAVCTDCHGAHNIQPVVEQPELIAGVCGDCHASTLVEWQVSAHVDIGPLGCATCHSPHSQRIRAGNTSDDLCVKCHNVMPDLWVHQQHTNTVENATVNCVDCHMFREPSQQADNTSASFQQVGLPAQVPTGHTMLVETTSCNTCHGGLEASGQWAQLTGGEIDAVRAERDELQQRITELEQQASGEAAGQQTSLVQLLQGLILGLGFGITVAAVFIARGNRQRETVDEHPDE